MNAPGLSAALRRLFQVLFRGFLALVLLGAVARCPWIDGNGGGGGGEEPTLIFVLDRSIVFMAPGDRASLHLSRTTDSERLATYEIVDRDDLDTGAPTVPADTTIAIANEDGVAGTAVLRIETGPGTAPGVYRIPLELTLTAEFTRQRTVTLVVLPTDATPIAGPVVAVAAGGAHSLALLGDGSVWAWGRNDRGQLGDGTLIDRQVPVPVVGLPGPVQAVAAGGRHSLALLDDGTVWGWGDNDREQVRTIAGGVPPPRAVATPVQAHSTSTDVGGEQDYSDIVAIAAGDAHNALLQGNGVVRMFGDNSRFQLARLGGYTQAAHATTLDLTVVDVVAVAAGGDHTLALGDDGSVWGWGASGDGQLGGLVNTPIQDDPIDLAFIGDMVGIGAGSEHTLLIDPDGRVGAFGGNRFGQLGDGSRETPEAQPKVPPFLLNVAQVDGGGLHSLAREADGGVRAWGNNAFGQVSDSGNMTPDGSGRTDQLVPVAVAGIPHSGDIAAGGRHSLSVDDLCGKAWSWGENATAQLGDAGVTPDGGFRASPMPVYGLGDDPPGAGCRVLLNVVTVGAGRVTVSDTPIDDQACALPCAAHFPAGNVVTLTAAPDPGSVFLGWGGNCTGADPVIDATMDRARSCRALFNQVPIPSFTIDPNPTRFGFDIFVDFDATGSTDPDGEIVEYAWDLEDDGTFDAFGPDFLSEEEPLGSHTVRLRVTDNQGTTADATMEWIVTNGPVARFTWDPETPAPGEAVAFDGSTSAGPQAIVAYEWDFDDDGTFDAAGAAVEHTFAAAGDHPVGLRVTDNIGFTGFRVQTVAVEEPGPGGDVTLTVVHQGGGAGEVASLVPDGDLFCSLNGPLSVPDPCALTVPSGTDVTLAAFPLAGSVFSHWGVGHCDSETPGDGQPNCNVTLTGDREVAVSFE